MVPKRYYMNGSQKVLNVWFPKETKLQFEDRAEAHGGTKGDNIARQDRALLTFLGVLSAFIMVGILRLSLPGNLTAGNPPSEKKKKKKKKVIVRMLIYRSQLLQLLVERKKLGHEKSIFLFPLKSPGRQLYQKRLCKRSFYDKASNYGALRRSSSRSTLHLTKGAYFWKIFGVSAVKTVLLTRYQK